MPVIGANTTRLGALIGPIASFGVGNVVVSVATEAAYDLGDNRYCTQFSQFVPWQQVLQCKKIEGAGCHTTR
jgi:hypothetical protein